MEHRQSRPGRGIGAPRPARAVHGESRNVEIDRTCWQCGHPTSLMVSDDPKDADWMVCEWCEARIISAAEFKKLNEDDEEERVKRALGFYDFKPDRDRSS